MSTLLTNEINNTNVRNLVQYLVDENGTKLIQDINGNVIASLNILEFIKKNDFKEIDLEGSINCVPGETIQIDLLNPENLNKTLQKEIETSDTLIDNGWCYHIPFIDLELPIIDYLKMDNDYIYLKEDLEISKEYVIRLKGELSSSDRYLRNLVQVEEQLTFSNIENSTITFQEPYVIDLDVIKNSKKIIYKNGTRLTTFLDYELLKSKSKNDYYKIYIDTMSNGEYSLETSIPLKCIDFYNDTIIGYKIDFEGLDVSKFLRLSLYNSVDGFIELQDYDIDDDLSFPFFKANDYFIIYGDSNRIILLAYHETDPKINPNIITNLKCYEINKITRSINPISHIDTSDITGPIKIKTHEKGFSFLTKVGLIKYYEYNFDQNHITFKFLYKKDDDTVIDYIINSLDDKNKYYNIIAECKLSSFYKSFVIYYHENLDTLENSGFDLNLGNIFLKEFDNLDKTCDINCFISTPTFDKRNGLEKVLINGVEYFKGKWYYSFDCTDYDLIFEPIDITLSSNIGDQSYFDNIENGDFLNNYIGTKNKDLEASSPESLNYLNNNIREIEYNKTHTNRYNDFITIRNIYQDKTQKGYNLKYSVMGANIDKANSATLYFNTRKNLLEFDSTVECLTDDSIIVDNVEEI